MASSSDDELQNLENDRLLHTPLIMSSSRHSSRKFVHIPTPKLSERKRVLFPHAIDDTLDDIENLSPLNIDSSSTSPDPELYESTIATPDNRVPLESKANFETPKTPYTLINNENGIVEITRLSDEPKRSLSDSVLNTVVDTKKSKPNQTTNPKVRLSLFNEPEKDMGFAPNVFYSSTSLKPLKRSGEKLDSSAKKRKVTAKKSHKNSRRSLQMEVSTDRLLGLVKSAKLTDLLRRHSESVKVQEANKTLEKDAVEEMDRLFDEINASGKRPRSLSPDLLAPVEVGSINRTESSCVSVEVPDVPETSKKKFFKGKRDKAMSVNLNGNINLKMEKGRMTLNYNPSKRFKPTKKESALNFGIDAAKMDDIMRKLDDQITETNPQKGHTIHTLTASHSIHDDPAIVLHSNAPTHSAIHVVEMDTNQSQHDTPTENLDQIDTIFMSPTALVCNMTSGLALHSPRNAPLPITKAANLNDKLDLLPDSSATMKYFPLFDKSAARKWDSTQMVKRVTRSRFGRLDDNQYQIDAGQKKWGLTQCVQCELVYAQEVPQESQYHDAYHNGVVILKFNGWRNERVVFEDKDAHVRVLEVNDTDTKAWWKKVQDVINFADRDLGTNEDVECHKNSKVYLYVEKRKIVAFVECRKITRASRMLPASTCCTTDTYPATCGINRIWVCESHRRRKIATKLLEIVQVTYAKPKQLSFYDDVAFSAVSDAGKLLVKSLINRDDYLVMLE